MFYIFLIIELSKQISEYSRQLLKTIFLKIWINIDFIFLEKKDYIEIGKQKSDLTCSYTFYNTVNILIFQDEDGLQNGAERLKL